MVTSFDREYDKTMADLLVRRETAFVLWHLANVEPPPRLIIGWVQPGTPIGLVGEQSLALRRAPGFDDLWELPASECGLIDGWTYYYWFEVTSSHPDRSSGLAPARIRITDPLATAVDWRLLGPRLGAPFTEDDRYPAAAVKFSAGRLLAADVGGEQPSFSGEPLPDLLPPNNRLVIYELPTAWTRPAAAGGRAAAVARRAVARSVQALHPHGAHRAQSRKRRDVRIDGAASDRLPRVRLPRSHAGGHLSHIARCRRLPQRAATSSPTSTISWGRMAT